MKDNIIGIVFFGLFFFSIYISAVTGFPYLIYFFIFIPIVAIIGIYFMSILEKKRIKKEHDEYIKYQQEKVLKIELDKKKKQEEWDNLPPEEKKKIITKKKKLEKEKTKIFIEKLRQTHENKRNAERLAEENRLREIQLIEENNRQVEIHQLKLIEDKKAKEKEIAEKRILQLQEQKEQKEKEHKEYIKRKILENERKKQLESEAIQELLDAGLIDNNHYTGKNVRESIPTDVKIAVWQRDKERCVSCFSNINLEFDHIIPVSKGGANSIKNIQLLCRNCNRTKSNKIM